MRDNYRRRWRYGPRGCRSSPQCPEAIGVAPPRRKLNWLTPTPRAFVALGLTPEAASSLIAPRLMGHANAFSLLVMGRPLNAGEAKALGIVNTVVSAAEVEAEAMKAAREISDLPPEAVLASRRLMRDRGEHGAAA